GVLPPDQPPTKTAISDISCCSVLRRYHAGFPAGEAAPRAGFSKTVSRIRGYASSSFSWYTFLAVCCFRPTRPGSHSLPRACAFLPTVCLRHRLVVLLRSSLIGSVGFRLIAY